jgi:hypothetical protein
VSTAAVVIDVTSTAAGKIFDTPLSFLPSLLFCGRSKIFGANFKQQLLILIFQVIVSNIIHQHIMKTSAIPSLPLHSTIIDPNPNSLR